MMKNRSVIISGGGTGGHIYPALAVGRKLVEKSPTILITFVGSTRPLEKKIMDEQGVRFIPMAIEGIKGRGLKSVKALVLLPFAFLKSLSLLVRIKPDLVIGVGGFSSGPIVLLASWLKTPTLILEQNAYPGFTNRLLVRWVRRAAVAFESSLRYFRGKGTVLGNPVREEFHALPAKPREERLTILVFGGSQGSHFLNERITAALIHLQAKKEMIRVFHQTGEADCDWVREAYTAGGFKDSIVAPYFRDMAGYFGQSDLVVSRAGATTVAELIAARKASILVPFAKAADDHQTLNARELEAVGGAMAIPESAFTPELFTEKIFYFIENRRRLDAMERNIETLRKGNAAEKIAHLCFDLMEGKA